jgi:hypothetical protein
MRTSLAELGTLPRLMDPTTGGVLLRACHRKTSAWIKVERLLVRSRHESPEPQSDRRRTRRCQRPRFRP